MWTSLSSIKASAGRRLSEASELASHAAAAAQDAIAVATVDEDGAETADAVSAIASHDNPVGPIPPPPDEDTARPSDESSFDFIGASARPPPPPVAPTSLSRPSFFDQPVSNLPAPNGNDGQGNSNFDSDLPPSPPPSDAELANMSSTSRRMQPSAESAVLPAASPNGVKMDADKCTESGVNTIAGADNDSSFSFIGGNIPARPPPPPSAPTTLSRPSFFDQSTSSEPPVLETHQLTGGMQSPPPTLPPPPPPPPQSGAEESGVTASLSAPSSPPLASDFMAEEATPFGFIASAVEPPRPPPPTDSLSRPSFFDQAPNQLGSSSPVPAGEGEDGRPAPPPTDAELSSDATGPNSTDCGPNDVVVGEQTGASGEPDFRSLGFSPPPEEAAHAGDAAGIAAFNDVAPVSPLAAREPQGPSSTSVHALPTENSTGPVVTQPDNVPASSGVAPQEDPFAAFNSLSPPPAPKENDDPFAAFATGEKEDCGDVADAFSGVGLSSPDAATGETPLETQLPFGKEDGQPGDAEKKTDTENVLAAFEVSSPNSGSDCDGSLGEIDRPVRHDASADTAARVDATAPVFAQGEGSGPQSQVDPAEDAFAAFAPASPLPVEEEGEDPFANIVGVGSTPAGAIPKSPTSEKTARTLEFDDGPGGSAANGSFVPIGTAAETSVQPSSVEAGANGACDREKIDVGQHAEKGELESDVRGGDRGGDAPDGQRAINPFAHLTGAQGANPVPQPTNPGDMSGLNSYEESAPGSSSAHIPENESSVAAVLDSSSAFQQPDSSHTSIPAVADAIEDEHQADGGSFFWGAHVNGGISGPPKGSSTAGNSANTGVVDNASDGVDMGVVDSGGGGEDVSHQAFSVDEDLRSRALFAAPTTGVAASDTLSSPAVADTVDLGSEAEVSALRAELKRVRADRDSAIAEAGELKKSSKMIASREASLRTEVDRLHAVIKEVDVSRVSLEDNFRESLAATEQDVLARVGEMLAARPSGNDRVERAEFDKACMLQDEERRRASASEAEAKSVRAHLDTVAQERNLLLEEKETWLAHEAALSAEKQEATSSLVDVECRVNAVTAERDAARDRCELLSAQMKKLGAQLGLALQERDVLAKQRAPGASNDLQQLESERENALLTLSAVQKQLASAMAKIDKLSTQRRTYLNQRDDAGTRLRAAGTEFQTLQDQFNSLTSARASAMAKERQLVLERDQLQDQLLQSRKELKLREGLEQEVESLKLRGEAESGSILASQMTLNASPQIEERCAKLELELASAKAKASVDEEDMSSVRTRCERAEEQLSNSFEEIVVLRSSVDDLRGCVAKLEKQVVVTKEDAASDAVLSDITVANLKEAVDAAGRGTDVLRAELSQTASMVESSVQCLQTALASPGVVHGCQVQSSQAMPKSIVLLAEQASGCLLSLSNSQQEAESRLSVSNSTLEAKMEELVTSTQNCERLEAELSTTVAELSGVRSSHVASEELRAVSEKLSRCESQLKESTTELNALWDMVEQYSPSNGGGWMSLGINRAQRDRNVIGAVEKLIAEFEKFAGLCDQKDEEIAAVGLRLAEATERVETAEAELGELRLTVDDVDGRVAVERERLTAQIRAEYKDTLGDLEESLRTVQDDAQMAESARAHLDAECEELRGLNAKLTSQFNTRTNELDDAEEKVAYLQDQVATLEEEVADARHTSVSRVEQSVQAGRSEVESVTEMLQTEQSLRQEMEDSLARVQAELDIAQVSAREATLLAETHRQAEGNLQIAIEQFEAERDAEIARQTASLRKDLDKALEGGASLKEMQEEASLSTNRIEELTAEVLELRAALGRLADERVELKLELEEKLSRLNHPDAGGQLVDRRVVRQLLVSYFRVDSLRRQDVLELMSRMLAFSEDDLIAVGIKRRRLMERLGSVVQAPHLDDGSPVPIGTVSEKWIEFLIKESTEQAEDDNF